MERELPKLATLEIERVDLTRAVPIALSELPSLMKLRSEAELAIWVTSYIDNVEPCSDENPVEKDAPVQIAHRILNVLPNCILPSTDRFSDNLAVDPTLTVLLSLE